MPIKRITIALPWVLLFVAFLVLGIAPLRESDSFFYLALAREFFRSGHFPAVDPFIYPLAGAQFHSYFEWLGCVLYYLGYLIAGYAGLIGLKIIFASIGFFPALNQVRKNQLWSSPIHFLLFFVGFIAFTLRYSERTSLMADAILVACLALYLADWQRGSAKMWRPLVWALPLLTIFWVNLHGSFPLAWVLCGMWLLSFGISQNWAALKARVWLLPGLMLVTLLNPLGLDGVLFPFGFLKFKSEFLTFITMEWNPTFSGSISPLHEVWFYLGFLLLAWGLILVSTWQNRSRQDLLNMAFLLLNAAFLTYLGISANRFVGISVMGLLLVVSALPLKISWRPKWVMGFATVSVLSFLVLIFSGRYLKTGLPHHMGIGVDSRIFPTQTVSKLKSLPLKGPVWNSFYFGCYLAWELDKTKPIFIHGFVTDMGLFQRFISGIGANKQRFDELTQQYGIQQMLIEKNPNALDLLRIVLSHPNWQLVAEDGASLLVTKK